MNVNSPHPALFNDLKVLKVIKVINAGRGTA